MADQPDHELATSHAVGDFDVGGSADLQGLPPVDRGKAAWLILTACFFLEAAVWGFIHSYGVIQDYYLQHEPFMNHSEGLAAVSTTATAIMLIGSPFISLLMQRFPNVRRVGGCVGLAVMFSGLMIASSTNSPIVVLWTQGVMYGIGALIIYFPAMFLIDEWFVERKGFAFGISWAGTGIGGATTPFLLQWLLHTYGHRTTLRVCAGIISTITLPCILFMRPRLPTHGPRLIRPVNLHFTRTRTFWLYQLPSTIQSLAAPLPALWLPSFASSSLSSTTTTTTTAGPLAVSLLNLSSCAGYLLHGRLVDRHHVSGAILLSTLGSSVAVFALWGCATRAATLYLFALGFGLFGAGYPGHWPGCVREMRRGRRGMGEVDTGMVLSLLCAGKGVGSVLAGPVSGWLLGVGLGREAGLAYGSVYGSVIVFTGVCVVVGGAGAVPRLGSVVRKVLDGGGAQTGLGLGRALRTYATA